MRFKLTLTPLKNTFGNRLPLNYSYEQSAALYRIFSQTDEEFTTWLHENGFQLANKKSFKLFSFSRFLVEQYRILKPTAEMEILSDTIEWYISFLPEVSTEKFIQGLFSNQQFEVGNRRSNVRFQVQSIEVLPQPEFKETMTYQSLSPICISLKRENDYDLYIPPNHPEAARLVRLNLLDKYHAATGHEFPSPDFPFEIEVLNDPKPCLITIKAGTPEQSKIRGFMCKFKLTAPVELQKVLYDAGCSGKNSVGFGCVGLVD